MDNNKKAWRPQPKVYKSAPYTVEAPGYKKVEGETIPRRNVSAKDGLISRPEEGVATIFDILKRSSAKFGNAKALGSRKLIKEHHEVKKIKKMVDGKSQEVDKKWTYWELGEYHYISFIEYERMCMNFGAGLRKLGMTAGDRIHVYAATSPKWLTVAHGATTQSMPIVTAYDTLGEEGLRHSLKQTKAKAIFLDSHLLKTLSKACSDSAIKNVIYNHEDAEKKDVDAFKKDHPDINLMGFDELQKLGQDNPVDAVPPKPEDICCIMYTSGSTGPPKGVLLKHSNVVAAVAGIDRVVGPYIGPGDGLLTYLPLAHIFEFVFECACVYWGGTMGYGNPKTLSDSSVRNCNGDIREFKPSILIGVPAVWEQVKKGIQAKVAASNIIVRNMFWGAMSAKSMMLSTGVPGAGVLDAIVFNKIKDATGGKLRICANGGGPIAKDTQRFISMAIAPMLGGYGLTETAAMGAFCDPASWTDNALGELEGSVEVKLVDVTEFGYLTNKKIPQGEIWIRGGPVVDGYLDLPEETEEAFTKDGWFKTGDIGEFDSHGNLKIIDRKKNLVKTLTGEYIALEKLESIYRSTPIVANICVYAAADKNKPVAIIVPAEPALKKLASSNGINGDSVEELAHDKKLNAVVLKELQNAGRSGGLNGIEIIEGVVLAEEEWNPQNGLTTSAQKINRKGILQKYQKAVDHAYEASG